MRKAQINPIKHVDPSCDHSLLTAGETTASEKNLLLQRIELLELENLELRKREEYLKMINATLLEALGNKETWKVMPGNSIYDQNPEQTFVEERSDFDHTNKMNSFKKKNRQKKLQLQEAHKRSIQTVYDTDLNPNSSYRKFQFFNEQQLSSSKQKTFSKTKPTSFYEKKQYQDIFKNRSATPKVQTKLYNNYNTQARKSVNSLMEPLQLHNSFSKKDIYVSCSAKSQKSHVSGSSQARNRNIATALLCDLCGVSYSPLEFITHAKECQANHYEQSHELNKITDKSFQEDQTDSDSEELLETLQQQKAALLNQINRLKRNRHSPDKRLQRNLDQIVFIINNKKSLNQKDIKTLLKQKNCYTSSTARKR